MTYVVKRRDSLARIARRHDVSLVALLAANPQYKADPNRINVGDRVQIPSKRISSPGSRPAPQSKALNLKARKAAASRNAFKVLRGQLTFDAEGLETRGRFFSRVAHVPGPWSGVTIGRGYDMRERSENEISADLVTAGISEEIAGGFAQARGLRGERAREFIREQGLREIEITPQQQKKLFVITYKELEGDVIRICTKADVVQKYGGLEWKDLHGAIRDVLVDLRYRGDYTGATREVVQPPAVRNDLTAFTEALSRRGYWVDQRGVPRDRYNRRRDYLQNA